MISVIIPVYNVEHCIQRCIDSILKQTYTDWELLLINDGSTDASGIICDNIAKTDDRIKVFHKNNGGVSSARNVGLKNAIGKWIVFVDSDDYVDPLYLNDFVFSSIDTSDRTIILQGIIEDNGRDSLIRPYPDAKFENGEIMTAIKENNLFSHGAPYGKLYNNDVIKQLNLRFPQTYSFGEDTCFFLRYLKSVDTLILVSKCNYHYVYGGETSLSHKPHEFDRLFEYALDNLNAVKMLENRFNCPQILIKNHTPFINGIIKKMLLDMSELKYSAQDFSKSYDQIRFMIKNYKCYRYSIFTWFILVCPKSLCRLMVSLRRKY